MIYDLHWDAEVYPSYTALPRDIRHALGAALVDAQQDPRGHTRPFGHDDGVMRLLIVGSLMAVLLIGEQSKSITVVQINHLG